MSEVKKVTLDDFQAMSKEEQEQTLKGIESIKAQENDIETEEKSLNKLNMKEFKEVIEETMKDQIKTMTAVDKKYFAFPGIGKVDDDISAEGKYAKTRKFFKAMATGDVKTARTMHEETRVKANLSEGTATAGGFLVPEEFKAEVLRLAPIYGVMRQNCRIIPMKYDIMNIPAAGATNQSAIWTNEGSQIKQTDPNFGNVVLTINKLAAIPKVTSELLADANIDVVNYLAELIAEAFAKEEDNQGFNGVGSPFIGVLEATGVPTSPIASGTGFTAVSYGDFVEATGRIFSNALTNAKFYLHRSMITHAQSLITTAGAPIMQNVGVKSNFMLGFPVVNTEAMPSRWGLSAMTDGNPYGVFGDLRKGYAMGERGSITMAVSNQATVDGDNLFENDMTALRMIERVCFATLIPSAWVRLIT